MSLLDPTLTKEELKVKHKKFIVDTLQSAMSVIKDHFEGIYRETWNNSDGLTPQEGFDALGTDSVQLLAISDGIQQLINSIVPGTFDYHVPTGLIMTINQDGTITITQEET
jgi:hypothetical protein